MLLCTPHKSRKPVLTERKENKRGKNKLSVCNPAKPAAFMWCADWELSALRLHVDLDPSQEDHACPTTHQPSLIHSLFPLHTHTHIYSLTKGVLRGTPGHCSGFLLYFMIWGVIEIHKQCCRHLSVFQKKNEYIKWIFWFQYLILKALEKKLPYGR